LSLLFETLKPAAQLTLDDFLFYSTNFCYSQYFSLNLEVYNNRFIQRIVSFLSDFGIMRYFAVFGLFPYYVPNPI